MRCASQGASLDQQVADCQRKQADCVRSATLAATNYKQVW